MKKTTRNGRKKMAIAVVLVVWAVLYLLTVGGMLAHFEADSIIKSAHWCRENQGFAYLWALLPPAILVGPFASGFYQDGFQWTCKNAEKREKA